MQRGIGLAALAHEEGSMADDRMPDDEVGRSEEEIVGTDDEFDDDDDVDEDADEEDVEEK